MEKGWIKLRTYTNALQAEIVKQMLEENGVPAVLLNKQDSSYLFGKIELFVSEEVEQQALALLEDSEIETDGGDDVN
ncbi:DUF2007 domain-containing protein [Sphingobacterium sp. Mn56C]|uniref:putative signal transducing protein n=1 Tax=Sphingobacterium sp. Mn56C TaxID=3395261 RepID=UPI003BCB0BE0